LNTPEYWHRLNTPKALANFSPEVVPTLGPSEHKINANAESVGNGGVTVRQRFQRWFCGW
jgi:hypothetical protein